MSRRAFLRPVLLFIGSTTPVAAIGMLREE